MVYTKHGVPIEIIGLGDFPGDVNIRRLSDGKILYDIPLDEIGSDALPPPKKSKEWWFRT